ncbi:MAG: hypothetical protein R2932_29655 [Caldilineaceae bacterium]
MYHFAKWDVLIVDDEPDVLTLSELAMEDFEVYGLPLVLHTAQTKAAAIALLEETPGLAMNLALAFVDVVMETDTAGLDLCNYIREDIGNRLTRSSFARDSPVLRPSERSSTTMRSTATSPSWIPRRRNSIRSSRVVSANFSGRTWRRPLWPG